MSSKHNESDWKRFRDIVPMLRDRYLEIKNKEIAEILTAENKTPAEQFWDTLEEVNKQKKILKDCLDGHSRSSQFFYMALMCRHKMIKSEDLEGFSEELISSLEEYLKN